MSYFENLRNFARKGNKNWVNPTIKFGTPAGKGRLICTSTQELNYEKEFQRLWKKYYFFKTILTGWNMIRNLLDVMISAFFYNKRILGNRQIAHTAG